MYRKVQCKVQQVVDGIWRTAVANRRHDSGASMAQTRKRWEAPGIAVVAEDESYLKVVLFMPLGGDRGVLGVCMMVLGSV